MANEPRNYGINRLTGRQNVPTTLASSLTSTAAQTTFAEFGGAYTAMTLMVKRDTTSATLESTAVSWRLQGTIDPASSPNWATIGAATRTQNSTAWTLIGVSSTAGITRARIDINSFTTSAGAASTAERRIGFHAIILPVG